MKQPPFHLNEITLSKWVGYQNMFGQELDERFTEIRKMEEGEDKRNAYLLHQFDTFCRQYAYYTDTPIREIMVMEVSLVMPIIKLQGEANISLKKEESQLDYNAVFSWNNQQWKIQPIFPKTVKMNREQFEASQDIALIFSDLQDGKHEALYSLCAAYLRIIDEPYSEDLMNSRIETMMQLPLSISLCVKKYIEDGITQLLKQ